MIQARGVSKRYGSTVAVDGLSFDARPGVVTGFLGPNGAGKSTTMRLLLGLDAPDAGEALIGGRRYRELGWPLREVGAVLEARAFHPGRSARAHLAALAASNDLPRSRAEEVLGIVGLADVAGRRAGAALARHGPAAGHRGRVAGGPRRAAAGRAGQRPGPRGDPLDAGPAGVAGRAGPGGAFSPAT
jgi:ABC-2 type transport system ATP-binding protein